VVPGLDGLTVRVSARQAYRWPGRPPDGSPETVGHNDGHNRHSGRELISVNR